MTKSEIEGEALGELPDGRLLVMKAADSSASLVAICAYRKSDDGYERDEEWSLPADVLGLVTRQVLAKAMGLAKEKGGSKT